MKPLPEIILASGSPRRAELLRQIHVSFHVCVSDVDESENAPTEPEPHVIELSRRKALAVATSFPSRIIVGADTIVALDNSILGKPETPYEAKEMLRRLSGRLHFVYTGVTMVHGDRIISDVERTTVCFRSISDEEIDRYVESNEPMDKAGGYGIQGFGALFVDGIQGCYFNVVGFPIACFQKMTNRFLKNKTQSTSPIKSV
ncbi:MAG: hypothetical protein B6244_01705 [Candidatus Cloacimonetes bacterium 4572_55]|nr:MAG: hypothetical protein B6244_01705 [Candidatus Cloacimonetes bacterium 4572_55]